MNEVDSKLSPMTRKAVKLVREEFPKIAEKYCQCFARGKCMRTGEKCEFGNCPKLEDEIGSRLRSW